MAAGGCGETSREGDERGPPHERLDDLATHTHTHIGQDTFIKRKVLPFVVFFVPSAIRLNQVMCSLEAQRSNV